MSGKCDTVAPTRPNPEQPPTHVYRGTMLGDRKGTKCRLILTDNTNMVFALIEFEDGYRAQVPRNVLRRLPWSPSSSSCSSPTSSPR
jgi:hypothetical protein